MFRKLVLYFLIPFALAGTFASLSAGLAACAGQSDLTPIFTPAPTKTVTPTFTPTLDFLHMERIPGLDPLAFNGGAGSPGEKLSLPQDVFSAARSRRLAPIEAEGGIASGCTVDSCTVMLTDHLVNGAELQQATDGKVIYSLDGQAGLEALFRFSGLPEGVRATAFVSQDGNPWGYKPGTVVVWFWEGGGKGPTQILNLDNPVQIMADTPNSISLTAVDNGLRITRTGPDGAVIDEQQVSFLPPEGTATNPTETPNSSPTLELSPEQLAAKKLYGSGFELKTEFQGIPVDLTVVTSKATLAQYKQTRGCFPNQEMKRYGASAEDRMAEMVFLGHYVGYLEDTGLTEDNYPFAQYLADLKAGRDRSFKTWGVRLEQEDGEFRINPLAPVEYVTTNAATDPDGNGRGTAVIEHNIIVRGYTQLENGGLRIVEVIAPYKNYFEFCAFSSMDLMGSLFTLGVPLEFLQGHIPMITPEYPITQARLDAIYFDDRIYNDSNHLLGPGILVP